MNKDNNKSKSDVQEPEQKKEKEYKQIVVVNDETDFGMFINNMEYFAKNKIPVAVNPNLLTESVMAQIRQENYFAQIQHDPNSMTHMIVKVMPQMKEIYEALQDAKDGKSEEFDPSTTDDVEKILEYPEDK